MKSNVRRRKAAEFRVEVLSRQLSNREREVTALRQQLAQVKSNRDLSAAILALLLEDAGGKAVVSLGSINKGLKLQDKMMVKMLDEEDVLQICIGEEESESTN